MDSVEYDPFLMMQAVGTVAFAVSGGAVAVRAGMDWLGVVVLAVVTAVAGGTMRDLLIGQAPVAWITDPWPIAVAVGVAALVIVLGHVAPQVAVDSGGAVLIADAVGLAAFTVAGVEVALGAGTPAVIACLLGVVTGAGGGVVRDVLARERPLILVGHIYALAALVGAVVLVVLLEVGAPAVLARWSAVSTVLVVRLLAVRLDWSLPGFEPRP